MQPAERLVFTYSVEGLLVRGLSGRLSAAGLAALRECGIDLGRPLRPAYPLADWTRALEIVARDVFPDDPPERAYFLLGERTVLGLEDTLLGKAQLAAARLVGPKRALLKVPSASRLGSNYSLTGVRELGPGHFEIWSEPYAMAPSFLQGSMAATLAVTGAREAAVSVRLWDPARERLELDARWAE